MQVDSQKATIDTCRASTLSMRRPRVPFVHLGVVHEKPSSSARMAVSGNNCRRMVPFRRRNEGKNVSHTAAGHMTIGLLEWQRGADPMAEHMAMLSGATRAYEVLSEPHRPFGLSTESRSTTRRSTLPVSGGSSLTQPWSSASSSTAKNPCGRPDIALARPARGYLESP
jgi:hypothetical protein